MRELSGKKGKRKERKKKPHLLFLSWRAVIYFSAFQREVIRSIDPSSDFLLVFCILFFFFFRRTAHTKPFRWTIDPADKNFSGGFSLVLIPTLAKKTGVPVSVPFSAQRNFDQP